MPRTIFAKPKFDSRAQTERYLRVVGYAEEHGRWWFGNHEAAIDKTSSGAFLVSFIDNARKGHARA